MTSRPFNPAVSAGAAVIAILVCTACTPANRTYPREALVEDVKRLAWIIEDAHPDPYSRGGGKKVFEERLRRTIEGVPEDGMSRSAFARYLMPLVASVGDAHTHLFVDYDIDWSRPGGVPLYFDAVGKDLYVLGVTREDERHLIGARLLEVEGVPVVELGERLRRVEACENEYGVLNWLCAYGYLWTSPQLRVLVPEWSDRTGVTVKLVHPDGRVATERFDVRREVEYPPVHPPSVVDLPSTSRCDFVYTFMDRDRKVALLKVDGMMHYREAADMWHNMGITQREETGRAAYRRYHEKNPPDSYEEVLAGIPSATELFSSLAREMKEAGTVALIVDVRRNEGGNSFMSNILVYFLYGREKLLSREPGLEAKKYSSFYFETYPNESLEQVNEGRDVPLALGDCDTLSNPRLGATPELKARREETLRLMTTFAEELDSGGYDGYYLPEHVLVVSDAGTFSAGYTMMRYLYKAGASLAGTPSAQSSNCFGDIIEFTLPNTGVRGTVSHKRYVDFPGDPEKGRALPMDYPLAYEKLASYGFDKNAEILLALEVAGFPALVDSLRS